MNLAALAMRGMPPSGKGAFCRDLVGEVQDTGAQFAAVNVGRADALDQARELGGAWLYSTPGSWRPDTWQEGLQRILQVSRRAEEQGITIHGILADPEGGWPAVSASVRDREALRMGEALRAIANGMRVGLTTYPMWPAREAFHAGAGDALFYAPQIYGRTRQDPDILRGWYAIWTALAGPQHCIPAIAGWGASPLHRTARGYREYLAMLPPAGGYIAWLPAGQVPEHIAEALRSYEPGGSTAGTMLYQLRAALLRPAVLGIAVAIGAVILIALYLMRRRGDG